MIEIKALKDLFIALPNSTISKPVHHNSETASTEPDTISWIHDRHGDEVGCINWQEGCIAIFDDYEYADEVVESLGIDRFERSGCHFTAEDHQADMKKVKGEMEAILEKQESLTRALYE